MRFRVFCLALIVVACAASTVPVLGQSTDRVMAPVQNADVLAHDEMVTPGEGLPLPPQIPSVKIEGFVTSTYATIPGDIVVNGLVIHVTEETFVTFVWERMS